MKWHSSGRGNYQYVELCKNGKRECKKVHRIVAETFIDNPYNLPCVNHKDENPLNNSVSNLEWCTYLYNNTYGNRTNKATDSNLNNPNFSKMVIGTNIKTNEERKFPSVREAARYLGDVKRSSNIQACLAGRQKTAYGYTWRYTNDRKGNFQILHGKKS